MQPEACSRRASSMRSAVFLTLARPAPKLAPPRCSRACRAVKREAGRALRMEIANLRCPRNGKRPRRTTQAGSGAFRVQVARGRGPLRVIRAGRRAGTPPARIPAEVRSLHGFMTRGLRGSGARRAPRESSSMLTPIVRTAFGAHRGVPRRAVAHTATAAGSPGPAATRAVAAPEPVAPCAASPLPPEVAAATSIMPDGTAPAMPIDPMRPLPLYCAECPPHAGAARRIVVVSRRCDRRSAVRPLAGRDRRHAGIRPTIVARAVARRRPCIVRGAARGSGIRAARAMTSPVRGSSVHISTIYSTRKTSLRMPETRRRATPVPHAVGNDGQRKHRASCAVPCGA